MSWINPTQPYIVPTDYYNPLCLQDYAPVNLNQPTDCCQQQQQQQQNPLYLTFADYNQSLMNFQFSDFSQYIAAEQTFNENENEIDHDQDRDHDHDDDDSDTSSEFSVPSPAEHPVEGYFAETRSEADQGESINSLLQRQNFSFSKSDLYCPPLTTTTTSSSFHNNNNNNNINNNNLPAVAASNPNPNPNAIFASHPLYNTFIALSELWSSTQDRMQEFSVAEFRLQAETFMDIASNNLNTMGGAHCAGDSVIRFQIGYLLDQLAEVLIAFDPKPDFACYSPDAASVDASISSSSCNDFGHMAGAGVIYHDMSPVSRDLDSESSSEDTVKEEYISPMSSKCIMKRKRDADEDDDQDDGAEEDCDDEDDFSKKGSVPKDGQKKRRENYTPDISFELFSWWFDNDGAAPNALAKQDLATKTGKTISQIATWYQNAKRRYSSRLEEFRILKAQHPHEVRDYGSFETYTRNQGSGSTTKRRRVQ